MFACPHCQKALQPLRGPQGMVWTCPICKGRAASFGVLRKSFGTERVATVVNESFAERTERGDACPVCQGATARVSWMEQDRPLSVDVCRRCEFVWFPPGEYESLVPAPPMHRLGDVDVRSLPIEVREQIAMEKAREIARQANLDQDPPDLTWKTAPALFGFPVEIDAVGTPRTTPATYLLAALIAAVSLGQFLIQYRDQVNLAQMFGLVPAQAGRYFGLTFVTSFFLHAGIWHLVGNLYFLVVFGRHVEAYLGSWRWLLVTAVSALAGGLVDVLCRAHSTWCRSLARAAAFPVCSPFTRSSFRTRSWACCSTCDSTFAGSPYRRGAPLPCGSCSSFGARAWNSGSRATSPRWRTSAVSSPA
jgi:membrane associated rhomboid family serine protease/Zn-finger nucleic acid-binding protein